MGRLGKIIRIIIAAGLLTVVVLYICYDCEWARTATYLMIAGICIYNLFKVPAAKK